MSINLVFGIITGVILTIAAIVWIIQNFISFLQGVMFTIMLIWLFSAFGLVIAIECLTWDSIIGSIIGWLIIIFDVILLLGGIFKSED